MAKFNIDKFSARLRDRALPPYGVGKCATYVRGALEAGGANTAGHPVHAKDWGPTLKLNNFSEVEVKNIDTFQAKKGDVAVIDSPTTSGSGHIQGYDGENWISDFVQDFFWPGPAYRQKKPSFHVYRP